ncbi:PREDICTED: remodeling and spacing factor 1-like [Nanorana parkeri]|uniref:remodeling and spacing factor 1-like n=1 Tax=Nanorana parkeri TaxID=125878 RepID=UPI000854ED68|nr:PREDICTED: remodeling and spacing factor 1-like [Nanorana parkeri]
MHASIERGRSDVNDACLIEGGRSDETEEVPEVQEKEEKKKKKSKPLERRSTRTRKFISYRFDEFDEAIDEAIEDDVRDADGGGVGRGKDMSNITGHHGKDIATILESERTEVKRPPRVAARRKKRRRLNDLDSDSNLDEDESEDEFRISEGSQEDFVVSDENAEESEDQQSNDSDFGARRPRRHYQRPVRKSTRLRKRVRRYSDDEEDDDDDSDEDGQESETDNSSAYSDDYLETRRRRSRRNQKRQVNYREDSESDRSLKRARYGRGKEMRRVLKRRFSSSESNASKLSGDSEDEKPKIPKKLLRKRIRSSDDEPSEEEEEKPIRKRPNRIETDEEDEEADAKPVDSSDKKSFIYSSLREFLKENVSIRGMVYRGSIDIESCAKNYALLGNLGGCQYYFTIPK